MQKIFPLTPEEAGDFSLLIRVPGWARNEVLPGGLYRFTDTLPAPYTVMINQRSAGIRVQNGIRQVKTLARSAWFDSQGEIRMSQPQDLVLIPYYAWANRETGEMRVWIPVVKEVCSPLPCPESDKHQ